METKGSHVKTNESAEKITQFIKNFKITDTAYRYLHIGTKTTQFAFVQNETCTRIVLLDIGIDKIVETYFLHTVPTESEVEYAINTIEDELMRYPDLISSKEILYTADQLFIDSFKVPIRKELSRQAIEDNFTQYALLSMGRSPVFDGIEMNKKIYAGVLILREIMHHLNFETVILYEDKAYSLNDNRSI